jgi:tryptophan-rich sensory protein
MESGIGVRNPTQATRILVLLVESGVIYILIGVSSALVYRHGLSDSWLFFALQVMSLASITIFQHFGLGGISDIFLSVSIQLAVRDNFWGITLGLY